MSDTVFQKICDLRREVAQHAKNYYHFNSPSISDADYDLLIKELRQLETEHPEFSDESSQTNKVGVKFGKEKHDTPMLSLENCFTQEDVERFFSYAAPNTPVAVEPKIDGLALSLKYTDGKLVKAVTRGDHEYGDNVTDNAMVIASIPKQISDKGNIEVRGEVFMPKSVFDSLNKSIVKDGGEPFANARNAAAGSLKLKDSSECDKRRLGFIAYHAIGLQQVSTYGYLLAELSRMQFKTPIEYKLLFLVEFKDVAQCIAHINAYRDSLDFDIDGAVIKLVSLAERDKLGNKTTAPKWAAAYKFPEVAQPTILTDIICQIGRIGTVTPVAILKPVHISGSTVKRASLCNQNEINRLGVNIGDEVQVVKSGAIIPKIVGVSNKKSDKSWTMPENCPCCGTPLIREGVHFFCPNKRLCKDQIFERLRHAVGKPALDLDGCGDVQVRTFVDRGITKLWELFSIDESQLDFMGEATKKKFLQQREEVKSAPLYRKLYALGIEGIGIEASKAICNGITELRDVVERGQDWLETLIGPVAAQNFFSYFSDSDNVADFIALHNRGVLFVQKVEDAANKKLAGKVFCITGAMVSGTRPKVAKMIEDNGGIVKGSVTKGVTHLVVGDGGGNNKAAAAKKNGTQCITEQELYAMAGIEMPTASGETNDLYD